MTKSICIFILILIMPSFVMGQSIKKQDSKLESNTLPPHLRGESLATIYDTLKKRFPEKDEFESTEQYNRRSKADDTAREYWISVELDYMWHLLQYDADSETLRIKLDIHHVYPTYKSERLKDFPPLAIALKNVATGQNGSIGSNVYGATANVTTYYAEYYYIAIVNHSAFCKRNNECKGLPQWTINCHIPREEAKHLKRDIITWNIGIVIKCKPQRYVDSGPFTEESVVGTTATLGDPSRLISEKKYVSAQLLGAIVFNSQSGNIYAKVDF